MQSGFDRDGQAQRFERFVRQHEPHVRAYAFQRSGGNDWERDVSGAFFRAWRSWELLSDEVPIVAHRAWLRRAVDGEISNRARGMRRQQAVVARLAHEHPRVLLADGAPASSPEARSLETLEAINRALGKIGARDRDLLTLRYWDEVRGPALAEALGVSEPAARKRLSRALAQLKVAAERELRR